MATIGRLVELLRDESAAAKAEGDQAAGERLREMADDPGDMSREQAAWIAQASDEQLRQFAHELRREAAQGG